MRTPTILGFSWGVSRPSTGFGMTRSDEERGHPQSVSLEFNHLETNFEEIETLGKSGQVHFLANRAVGIEPDPFPLVGSQLQQLTSRQN